MNRTLLAVALAALVGLAGCSAIPGGQSDGTATPTDERLSVADDRPGATDVNQTLRVTVDESTNGTEWTAVSARYPRGEFAVEEAQHEDVRLGIDTDADGALDRRFGETHVSGVNTNEYSFAVTLDTDYTLRTGDVVVVEYPNVSNPNESGEYDVEVGVNDRQNATATVSIG